MDSGKIAVWTEQMENHLTNELLPFWTSRCWDEENGGYLTQFDTDGNDTGTDEKSLLAHMRTIYSLTLAHQFGHDPDGVCIDLARKGVDFALEHYWDTENEGFYWLFNRRNEVIIDRKCLYGQSFAIYALSTFSRVTGDKTAQEYAEKCFNLLQIHAADICWGGYWEMFEPDWTLSPAGSAGGDRKTLDVHMHLMEAFTALYLCSGKDAHKRRLGEIVDLLVERIMHPKYGTGVPQFFGDWSVAPQIKFDIVWGWDRFTGEDEVKENALDNTSYGHNVEFFWLALEALKALGRDEHSLDNLFSRALDHAVGHGVDKIHGGVFVEGSHDGSHVYDTTKEFWQQAEFLTGMLDAYRHFGDERYLGVYENVHNFVMQKMIKHQVGEWWPLLTQEGEPIWTHMSHSWKVNYHTIRGAVLSLDRLGRLSEA